MKVKILIVEDDEILRDLLCEVVALENHDCASATSVDQAAALLGSSRFDILLTDVNLPDRSGLELLTLCARLSPATYKLVMTGAASIDVAVTAMKNGAADFLTKPISFDNLRNAIRVAVERLAQTRRSEIAAPNAPPAIVAASPAMLDLLAQIERVAPFRAGVLITGETGTGKELVARRLHEQSQRRANRFVALNCAAIPENLLEDELFGHVKGAFTGAQAPRAGRLEQADGGTLFLDEIGELNFASQAKLLRVLQESEFEKLGSSRTIKVDARVVAATSVDLERKIAENAFRPDLYHRLNVIRLRVPPLRERPADVLPIARFLLERFCRSVGLLPKSISPAVAAALEAYDFPGNVRQLQNAVERAAIYSDASDAIEFEHLPEEIQASVAEKAAQNQAQSFAIPPQIPDEGLDLTNVVSNVERELVLRSLNKTGGNKMRAAKLLNIKRTTLIEKLKRLNIDCGEKP